MNRTKPIRDITGQRFGNLEVLKMVQVGRKDGQWMAVCKCYVCGREDYIAKPYWIKGEYGSHTKSCGCDKTYFKRQTGRNSSRFKGYEDMNSYYLSNAERRSKQTGMLFDLDAKFLWELFIKQNKKCALSGVDIVFSQTNRFRSKGTASLDRIDSNKGYTKDNVQWVHKHINNIKMEFSQPEFFDWCKKVVLFNHLLPTISKNLAGS